MTNCTDPMTETLNNEVTLESWKEIAAYLKRTERTVRRWEKEEGLPVRRHMHQFRASVYAYPSELDAWVASRQPRDEADAVAMAPLSRWRSLAALAAALLLTLVSAGSRAVPAQASDGEGGSDVVARRIWSGGEVDFLGSPSSDGHYLSFVDWSTGDLAIRDLTTNENRRLTNKGTWADNDEYAEFSKISPDGKQVAYAWFNGKFYELRVIGTDSSNPRVLYRNEQVRYVQPSAWSADGAYLYGVFSLVERTNQIVRVKVADGTVQVLKSTDWRYPDDLRLSPDGHYLAYDFPPQEDRGERDIYLLTTDGAREVPLVQHSAQDFLLGWMPDGNAIVFASGRTGTTSAWLLPVEDGGAAGSPRLIRQNLGSILPIGFDGNGAFYYAIGDGRDVYTAGWDSVTGSLVGSPSNATERFVSTNAGPDWSPDGEYLSYVSRRGFPQGGLSGEVIVIRSVRTGEEREISSKINLMNNRSWPRWSPDGRSLLLAGRDTKGRRGFFRMDVASGETTRLVDVGPLEKKFEPEWAASGKSIVYYLGDTKTQASSMARFDVETGKESILFRSRHIHTWSLSPDGQQIAVAVSPPEDKSPTGMGSRLLLISVLGGEPRTLRSLPLEQEFKAVAWSPDGGSLFFMQGDAEDDGSAIWRLSLSTGSVEPAHFQLEARQLKNLRFSPDGKRAAYIVYQATEGEIWMLENFLPQLKAAQ